MSTERERLISEIRKGLGHADIYGMTAGPIADALLAAGIKLPPEPPAPVTEEMLARNHQSVSLPGSESDALLRPDQRQRPRRVRDSEAA